MAQLAQASRKFFGLLELDAEGTVLYARSEAQREASAGDVRLIPGSNLFSENALFKNIAELRSRFECFSRSLSQSDSFEFTCQFEDEAVPVRILLARIHELRDSARTKSLLIHIRKI